MDRAFITLFMLFIFVGCSSSAHNPIRIHGDPYSLSKLEQLSMIYDLKQNNIGHLIPYISKDSVFQVNNWGPNNTIKQVWYIAGVYSTQEEWNIYRKLFEAYTGIIFEDYLLSRIALYSGLAIDEVGVHIEFNKGRIQIFRRSTNTNELPFTRVLEKNGFIYSGQISPPASSFGGPVVGVVGIMQRWPERRSSSYTAEDIERGVLWVQEQDIEIVKNVIKNYFLDKKARVRAFTKDSESLEIVVDHVQGEVLSELNYWERLQIIAVLTGNGIYFVLDGSYSSGLKPPPHTGYYDMEPVHYKELEIYANNLVDKIDSLLQNEGKR